MPLSLSHLDRFGLPSQLVLEQRHELGAPRRAQLANDAARDAEGERQAATELDCSDRGVGRRIEQLLAPSGLEEELERGFGREHAALHLGGAVDERTNARGDDDGGGGAGGLVDEIEESRVLGCPHVVEDEQDAERLRGVLELTQRATRQIEELRRGWKGMEGHGRARKGMEGHGRAWKAMEGHGRA